MKKTLVALFTLVALSLGTQSFAACCNSCNSCTSNFYYPKTISSCPCACAQPCPAAPCCSLSVPTGCACPITSSCNSCCDSCNNCGCNNNCCREKCSWWKFWQNKCCCDKCDKCCDCCGN